MALCVVLDTAPSGLRNLVSTTGRTEIVWSAGEATVSGGQYTCPTGSYVLLTASEAGQQTNIPLLQLSPAEGSAIASAILVIWAAAWGIRVLVQTVRSSDGNQPSED
ncbi:hypothetical protein [Acidovorax sp. sic0104]|uniref:hypothetical protein n=1 Tax=Acidovorax sp. sic0104 TaxID=2854784 RepID=UPI001C48C038|nr:hypothetical protein [Acidovorax sp. sic0104]